MGTLWYNGNIYTLDREGEKVEAVFVEDGKIVATGTEEKIRNQFKVTKEYNLKGNSMYPGFVDSHLHLIGHGEKLSRLDLSEMTSSEEIIAALKEKIKVAETGEWIIGEGWNENQLADRKIFHRHELDAISSENPMMLTRVCRHAVIVNSKALQLANINFNTVNPVGGVIVKDDKGEPTGYLLDTAQELVKSVIPAVSESYLERTLNASIDDCLRLGLVGGHSEDMNYYGGFERTFNTFKKVLNGKEKKFRTNLLIHHEVVSDMHKLGYTFGPLNDWIDIGAVKMFADGALGGRTALLSHPYNDAPDTSGVAIHSLPELKKLVKKAREYEMPVAIHVIGDLAFQYAVEAIEEFPPIEGQRDRLIHAQILREELIDRAVKLPLILDIQPRFVATDFPWVIERIGEANMKSCYAWKTLLNKGFHCAGGSDAPIEPVDPLLGIHAAVTRKNSPSLDSPAYSLSEALSVFEAVSLFTTGSAFAIGQESTRGKIIEGHLADFTVFDRDLFNIPEDDIVNAKVVMTIVDNTVMYEGEL
ncbi:amidohydrolase [Bacillus timonensis]|nr:amidohydrolase [Bacillus timonensis]